MSNDDIVLVSTTQTIVVGAPDQPVNVIAGGSIGPPGTDGVNGVDGAKISEGTSIPGNLPYNSFFFDTDATSIFPMGVVFSGNVGASAGIATLSTTLQDVPGCTTGALALLQGDVVKIVGVFDAVIGTGLTMQGVLDISGAAQTEECHIKNGNGTDRITAPQTWDYTVPSNGNYTFKLQAKLLSGATGAVNITHTTIDWTVYRTPPGSAGAMYYKRANGTIVLIGGVGGGLSEPQVINAQTGTAYTLALTDPGKLVTLNNAGTVTVTLPTNAVTPIAIGQTIAMKQLGAGQVIVSGAGTTIRVSGVGVAKARAQYSRLWVEKIATDTWSLWGDIAAS